MPLFAPKPQLSRVNARHLLDDLASGYSYSLADAVLVELVANALDAGATKLSFNTNPKNHTLTAEDNGRGMWEDEFVNYHDLAESRKVRGRGIGFAGLGAKIAHKLAVKVVTETHSEGYHGASEWYWKDDDLEWKYIRAKALRQSGTRVTIWLKDAGKSLLDPRFIERSLLTHYGALIDPFLAELYVWESIYPQGVTFQISGGALPQRPLIPPDEAEKTKPLELISSGKGKRRVGRAVFALMKESLGEAEQGVAIATYGKTILRDPLGIYSKTPDRITGWVEIPGLVECLQLNKQAFIDHGTAGARYRQLRRILQKAFGEWLTEIGESAAQEDHQRAPRRLEQETARILSRVKELRYLFKVSVPEAIPVADPSGEQTATTVEGAEITRGKGPGQMGEETAPIAPGADQGEALTLSSQEPIKVRLRPRRSRSGPRIERIDSRGREDMSWVDGDTVFVNTSHLAYVKAQREGHLPHYELVAVLTALCNEAPVEPESKLALFIRALSAWGHQ